MVLCSKEKKFSFKLLKSTFMIILPPRLKPTNGPILMTRSCHRKTSGYHGNGGGGGLDKMCGVKDSKETQRVLKLRLRQALTTNKQM